MFRADLVNLIDQRHELVMDGNWLRGAMSDAMHAVLCGAGHNLRMILTHLRVLLLALIGPFVLALLIRTPPLAQHPPAAPPENGLFRALTTHGPGQELALLDGRNRASHHAAVPAKT